jgi:glycosyltransferase involved in cell wall biosynthesis
MKNSIQISALVITYNEENNIERCLNSLDGIADEIMVIDSFSTDRTAEICQDRGVDFGQHRFEGHVEQKNYALSRANFDHVLSLDADEALSEKLKQSILAAKQNWAYDGYTLNRLTDYCGKWIRHCGWYPDKKLRLWDRRKGRWGGVNPHDHVIMDKNCCIGHLRGDLLHYSYPTIKQHVSQIDKFSDIAARAAFQRGRRANVILDICMNPTLTFIKKYFLKLGILDGYEGFIISISTAYGKFLKYIKLRELEKQGEIRESQLVD